MKLGRLLLRASVGGFFIGHGTQKLFGWFGGHGLTNTAEMFDGMGMRPGQVHATAAGVAETAGGAGLLLGFETPLASSAVIATMLTAINRVHLKNGPWVSSGGYEYNVVLIAAALTLAEIGPGGLSIDGVRGVERSGDKWALIALALGIAGAAGAHVLAESQKPPIEFSPATAEPSSGPVVAPAPVDAAPAPVELDAEVAVDSGAPESPAADSGEGE